MANESVHIELNKLPAHESDTLCRTVTAAVHRLLQDPKNRRISSGGEKREHAHEEVQARLRP
jgi:hypothetical protein